MSRWSLVAALCLCSSFATFGVGAPAHATEPSLRLVYAGRLQDAQGRPIAGIYPLTFNFYRTEKAGRATWSESHFVAVDNGVYAVELGAKKPIPKGTKVEQIWLGVALSGGKEIVREKFAAAGPTAPSEPAATDPGAPPTTAGLPPAKSSQSYAELAGFAYEAEKARSADAIGGMSAQDIKNLAKTTTAGSKAKVGSAKRYSDTVGGTGGSPYTLQCPAGYVVTGIKGGAAAFVDSLTLICSPLE